MEPTPASKPMRLRAICRWNSDPGINMYIPLHLVQTLRIIGVSPPGPNTSLWRSGILRSETKSLHIMLQSKSRTPKLPSIITQFIWVSGSPYWESLSGAISLTVGGWGGGGGYAHVLENCQHCQHGNNFTRPHFKKKRAVIGSPRMRHGLKTRQTSQLQEFRCNFLIPRNTRCQITRGQRDEFVFVSCCHQKDNNIQMTRLRKN
jgi:hypothetical protein